MNLFRAEYSTNLSEILLVAWLVLPSVWGYSFLSPVITYCTTLYWSCFWSQI